MAWIFRDETIGTTFFDAAAAKFLVDRLAAAITVPRGAPLDTALPPPTTPPRSALAGSPPSKRSKHETAAVVAGPALGPNWNAGLAGRDAERVSLEGIRQDPLVLVPSDEVVQVEHAAPAVAEDTAPSAWPLTLRLATGRTLGCDLMVSATGVSPHLPFVPAEVARGADGGLAVDRHFRTNAERIYAAGDASTASWDLAPTWHQMRLWTQARVMGIEAARAMADDAAVAAGQPSAHWVANSLAFELFSHVTEFFGLKVVLLGRYAWRQMENERHDAPNVFLIGPRTA